MRLKIRRSSGIVSISMEGKLDGSSAWQVKDALEDLCRISRKSKLYLDFNRVRQWEHFGVVILAKSLRSIKTHFHEIRLNGMDETLLSLFQGFGFSPS